MERRAFSMPMMFRNLWTNQRSKPVLPGIKSVSYTPPTIRNGSGASVRSFCFRGSRKCNEYVSAKEKPGYELSEKGRGIAVLTNPAIS